MEIEIVVHGDPAGDEVRNLRGWLLDESDLHGRVSLRERPAEPGTLPGGIPEALVVAAGGGTALALVRTFGNVLITWLKTRRGQVDITITGPDGTKVVLATKDVRGLGVDGVREVLDDLTEKLMSQATQAGSTDGQATGRGQARTRRQADPAS